MKILNGAFSHIYVERGAKDYSTTKGILKKFENAKVVEIDDYKEIFSRANQDFELQKRSPKLILATKKDNFIYEGAKVCESFGNINFYYSSMVLNCVYNCEYCYLQGVYSSGNIVIFVNIEDCFEEIEKILETKSMYICISYDTDLLALEGITGFVKKWYDFVTLHKNLKIELRTKSSNIKILENLAPNPNFILAWTISPQDFARDYEEKTAPFKARLESIRRMQELGWSVRLCFDPLLKIEDFEKSYEDMVTKTFEVVDGRDILDVSIGTFRISKEYLKRMKKNHKSSKILNYPFECTQGVYSYGESENRDMIDFVKNLVLKYVTKEKIYV